MHGKISKGWGCFALRAGVAVISCMALTLVSFAATTYNTASKLFTESLYISEQDYYNRVLNDESNFDSNGKQIKTDVIINRKASASINVTANNSVYAGFKIVIPKSKTLTVDEGATLKIYGELLIEGTLDNKGTIIIGTQDNGAFVDGVVTPFLTNSGSIVNAGTIKIVYGTLNNKSDARLENNATITISTKHPSITALHNRTFKKNDVITVGTIVNNGTINVENTKGTGIKNASGGIFENNGTIYKAKYGTVNGSISGNGIQSK